ncbi:hypothetical protein [Pleionea sediminis]|uniref:hypothetical protein n=1 Tax=Pleionea sediminis TaxID=2569479 RepID=UPI00118613BC|nr:hypothetical protein [Pleionea sediminis]
MDFKEIPGEDTQANVKKNRATLIALAVVFISPVLFAYLAYFNNWFTGGGKSHGEIIDKPWHIEDLNIVDTSFGAWENSKYMGKWNWLLVMDQNTCNEQCQTNYFLLQQTHLGLGKNTKKNNFLLVLNQQSPKLFDEWLDVDTMRVRIDSGKVALNSIQNPADRRGLNGLPIPANAIYLVDPLGNIFLKYDLINSKEEAPIYSKGLRSDISRVMRVLDVSSKNE